MKRTKHYLVTHIDPYLFPQSQDLEDKIFNALGVWSATDEGDLEDKVRQYIHPYSLRSFEFTNNRPHSLTAYK